MYRFGFYICLLILVIVLLIFEIDKILIMFFEVTVVLHFNIINYNWVQLLMINDCLFSDQLCCCVRYAYDNRNRIAK